MTFIEHNLNWVKGEIFQASMLAIWGTLLVLMAAFFWKYDHTATTKALIGPFLIVGLFWGITGSTSLYVNNQRIDTYSLEFENEPGAFVNQERKRVDGLLGMYRYLLIGWSVMILAGVLIFMLWGGNYGRAVGLGLILFGITGFMADPISERNAYVYNDAINKELQSLKP